MCYNPDFLEATWATYLGKTGLDEDQVDPDTFVRWAFSRAMDHRQPRYRAMADRWGVTVQADDIAAVRTQADMVELVARALEARA
jgi:hypothetical protein